MNSNTTNMAATACCVTLALSACGSQASQGGRDIPAGAPSSASVDDVKSLSRDNPDICPEVPIESKSVRLPAPAAVSSGSHVVRPANEWKETSRSQLRPDLTSLEQAGANFLALIENPPNDVKDASTVENYAMIRPSPNSRATLKERLAVSVGLGASQKWALSSTWYTAELNSKGTAGTFRQFGVLEPARPEMGTPRQWEGRQLILAWDGSSWKVTCFNNREVAPDVPVTTPSIPSRGSNVSVLNEWKRYADAN